MKLRWPSWRSRRRHHPDERLDGLPQRGFIAIDLETTGLDPRRDRIVSLAALEFVGGDVRRPLVTLVDPGVTIPAAATSIHGLDAAAVAGAPDEASVVQRFDAVGAGQVIVGHGVVFDVAVLARARGHARVSPGPLAILCTQRLAGALYPAWTDLSLEAVCAALGVSITGRHTADGDALAAGHLFIALIPRLQARGICTLAETLWLQENGARQI